MKIEELIEPLEGHELRSCHCSSLERILSVPRISSPEDLAKLIAQVKTS